MREGSALLQAYWCVHSIKRDDGSMNVSMYSREYEEKPNNTRMDKNGREDRKSWFLSEQEAAAFYEEIAPKRAALQEHPVRSVRMLTPGEVASILNISDKQVYVLANKGAIRPIKINTSVRFHPDEIEKYVFLSKLSETNMACNPSDIKELLRHMKEWHERENENLSRFLNNAQKRRMPMKQ